MTRDEIINYALQRLRDRTAIVFQCDVMCNYINDGYSKVIGANPYWPFKDTLDAASDMIVTPPLNAVTLPTDAFEVLGILNTTDGIPMREITGRKSWMQMFPLQSDTPGPPLYYRLFNNTIQVFPYPSQATQLRVEYKVRPGRFASASDVPVFPSEFHGMLVEYIMALAYQDDGNPQQATAHMAVFEERLAEMKADLLGPRGDSYAQIDDDLFY